MQVRLAKMGSAGHAQVRSAAKGRHRLPPDFGVGAGSSSSTSGSSTADVGDGFDEELSPTPHDVPDETDEPQHEKAPIPRTRAVGGRWPRVIAFGLLPALTVVLGGGAGYLTWEVISARFVQVARVESVRAATDGAVALLTYGPDTVGKDVGAARERLTGKFKDFYTLFTRQNVIPNAREKHVSSVVTVPAAAIVRVTTDHAVVMVFVNQTFLSERDPPTSTASDVRVTLEKVGRRWLISEFTPA